MDQELYNYVNLNADSPTGEKDGRKIDKSSG